jgi:hypothetical protein
LNTKKTRLQNSKNGAIHVTGVALTDTGVRPTRSTLRRIRAATHQDRSPQVKGLTEWARCKLPKQRSEFTVARVESTPALPPPTPAEIGPSAGSNSANRFNEGAQRNTATLRTEPRPARSKWEGSPCFIQLDCGREVQLTDLMYSRTYGGLLEGRPTPRLNELVIKEIVRREPWGNRSTHFIKPVLDESDPKHPVLPCVTIHAWLASDTSISGNACGSDLIVIWLTDECHHESIAQTVHNAVRALRWNELASDFDY